MLIVAGSVDVGQAHFEVVRHRLVDAADERAVAGEGIEVVGGPVAGRQRLVHRDAQARVGRFDQQEVVAIGAACIGEIDLEPRSVDGRADRLEVKLDRLILVGRKTGLARRHAERGRVGTAEVAARGIARDVERMVATADVDNGLIARRAKDLPAVLAVGDRAGRHVVEGLRVAGGIGEGQVLDIGSERKADRRLHRVDAVVERFRDHVANVVDDVGIVAGTAQHGVGARAAVEDIGAVTADERVGSGGTDQVSALESPCRVAIHDGTAGSMPLAEAMFEACEKNELRSTDPPTSSMLMTAHGSRVPFGLAFADRVTSTLLFDPVKLSKPAIR